MLERISLYECCDFHNSYVRIWLQSYPLTWPVRAILRIHSVDSVNMSNQDCWILTNRTIFNNIYCKNDFNFFRFFQLNLIFFSLKNFLFEEKKKEKIQVLFSRFDRENHCDRQVCEFFLGKNGNIQRGTGVTDGEMCSCDHSEMSSVLVCSSGYWKLRRSDNWQLQCFRPFPSSHLVNDLIIHTIIEYNYGNFVARTLSAWN